MTMFTELGRKIDAFLSMPETLKSIERKLEEMDQNTQNAFADLRTEVEAVKSNEAAAATLLQGLHDQLDTALSQPGASSDDIVAAITDITAQLKSDTDSLAAAVAANSGNSSSTSGASSGSDSTGSGAGSDTTGTGSSDTGSAGTGSTDTTETGTGSTDTTTSGDAGAGTGTGEATDPTA